MIDKEDIEKPITKAIGALQGTPMLLSLIIINILVLGMITYLLKTRGEHSTQERTEIIRLLNDCLEENRKHGGVLNDQNFKLKLKGLQ